MVQKTNVVKHKPNEYHKKKHTGLIIVIILIVAALATAGVLLFLNREKIFPNDTNKGQTDTSKQEKKEEKSDSKEKEDKKQNSETREAEKASINQNDGEDPNTLDKITGVINFAGISENNFMVTATLDQALGNSGSCKFTISNGSGAVIVSDASISAGPTTSFCSYSTPASGISAGYYSISIDVSANGKKGTIIGEVNI